MNQETKIQPKSIVISQSMYFPWCGLLNQIKYADFFVHYDDVQFARGFLNRVQAKTSNGLTWLTVPLQNKRRGQKINECIIDYSQDWRTKHREILRNSYIKTPYLKMMLEIFDSVVSKEHKTLDQLSRESIHVLASAFEIKDTKFINSSDLSIGGKSSERLLNIVKFLKGDRYITGHGALNYLDKKIFDRNNIEIKLIKYKIAEWNQPFGEFTPYVTSLDCLANMGYAAKDCLQSSLIDI